MKIVIDNLKNKMLINLKTADIQRDWIEALVIFAVKREDKIKNAKKRRNKDCY